MAAKMIDAIAQASATQLELGGFIAGQQMMAMFEFNDDFFDAAVDEALRMADLGVRFIPVRLYFGI